MALVADRWGLIPELQRFANAEKRPIWGTCAGLIFLANQATGEASNTCNNLTCTHACS
jgi:5'-phosphate synthase pdxT subunit